MYSGNELPRPAVIRGAHAPAAYLINRASRGIPRRRRRGSNLRNIITSFASALVTGPILRIDFSRRIGLSRGALRREFSAPFVSWLNTRRKHNGGGGANKRELRN
jgi:hypothetical protein